MQSLILLATKEVYIEFTHEVSYEKNKDSAWEERNPKN